MNEVANSSNEEIEIISVADESEIINAERNFDNLKISNLL